MNLNLNPNIDIISYFEKIFGCALSVPYETYERGILEFFRENKDSFYDLTNSSLNYKKMGTLSSVLDMLRYQGYFLCEIHFERGLYKMQL